MPINKYTCCICGREFMGYGNNPYPLCDKNDYDSRCCDECDIKEVLPARLIEVYKNKYRMEPNNDDK